MPNAIKWETTLAAGDQGSVLTTGLDSLAASARTNAGTAFDNGSGLHKFGWLELLVDFVSAPSAGGYVNIYMIPAPDGTNYADGSSSVAPASNLWVVGIPILNTTSAQRLVSSRFELPPCPVKFILENMTDQSFPASGSTLDLYTANEEIQ